MLWHVWFDHKLQVEKLKGWESLLLISTNILSSERRISLFNFDRNSSLRQALKEEEEEEAKKKDQGGFNVQES